MFKTQEADLHVCHWLYHLSSLFITHSIAAKKVYRRNGAQIMKLNSTHAVRKDWSRGFERQPKTLQQYFHITLITTAAILTGKRRE
jgi:hypothetical protein